MSLSLSEIRRELRPMIALSVPVALGELGWMMMGVVDVMMVGRLGPEAIGAVGVGRSVFWAISVPGIGFLLGLDTLISRAYGAGDLKDCHRSLIHGIYVSLAMAAPVIAATLLALPLLKLWGLDPAVEIAVGPYVRALAWSTLPVFLYATFRRYLQAIDLVRPVMVALVSANLINVFANWLLIFGKLGAPALGVRGAGWATVASSCYLALFLLAAIALHDRRMGTGLHGTPLTIERARLRRMATLGLPSALQVGLEIGVFALATVLAARFDAVALAAHQIALNVASVTFMVPLGISSASAVRVGQGIGRRDGAAAVRAGWTGLALGGGFMALAAIVMIAAPRALVGLFSDDPDVLRYGAPLLGVAAMFQLFDALQVVATGNLRGSGDTRTPMIWNLIGHWTVGLPISVGLAFGAGWGVTGLWIGLCAGLVLIGAVLLRAWSRRARQLLAGEGFR